jgi:murein DD-endopeptidase MepM/ murein hydrolase activator NlpD
VTTGLISPLVGNFRQTTDYGAPNAYNNEPHYAIDWSAPEGTPVYASVAGKVTKSDAADRLGGNIVRIAGSGFEVGYAHLSRRFVSVGDTVQAGQIIGTVGSTGEATTGAHLHFSVEQGGKFVNPMNFIDALTDEGHESMAAWWNEIAEQWDLLIAPGESCPTGTKPGAGPNIGNPLPGWNTCYSVNGIDKLPTLAGLIPRGGGDRWTGVSPENIPGVAQIMDLGEFLGALGGFLFNPQNWIRLGALTGGVVLLGFGSVMVYRAT